MYTISCPYTILDTHCKTLGWVGPLDDRQFWCANKKIKKYFFWLGKTLGWVGPLAVIQFWCANQKIKIIFFARSFSFLLLAPQPVPSKTLYMHLNIILSEYWHRYKRMKQPAIAMMVYQARISEIGHCAFVMLVEFGRTGNQAQEHGRN